MRFVIGSTLEKLDHAQKCFMSGFIVGVTKGCFHGALAISSFWERFADGLTIARVSFSAMPRALNVSVLLMGSIIASLREKLGQTQKFLVSGFIASVTKGCCYGALAFHTFLKRIAAVFTFGRPSFMTTPHFNLAKLRADYRKYYKRMKRKQWAGTSDGSWGDEYFILAHDAGSLLLVCLGCYVIYQIIVAPN